MEEYVDVEEIIVWMLTHKFVSDYSLNQCP